jgi:lactose/L-arabinose transport system substrate-binding protein
MVRNRKRFVNVALSAILTLSLAAMTGGCSTSSPSSSSSKASTASTASTKLSGTITEASWNDAATAMKAEAAEFMAENPGTTVTVQSVDSNYTKLYAELAAGSGVPDVVQTQNRDFMSFLNKYPDAWLDVTDLVQPEESNFTSYVLDLVKKDSKYYAVPWDLGPCAMYYRTDIFKTAGVDVSTIKTYDDFITAGEKIVKATNGKSKMLGLDYSGSSSRDVINLFFNQLGGKFYDSNGKVKLNSAEMIQTLTLVQKMVKSGITLNLPNEWNDRITAISNNQLATIPYAVWYAGTMESSNADQSGKWGIVSLPAFTAGGNTQANEGGSILAISSDTKNSALAKAFVKFSLMSSKGNKINLDSGKLFTSYKPSYKDSEYSSSTIDPYFGLATGATFAGLTANIPTMTFGPYYTDVDNALKTAVGNVLVKNEDPTKALTDASAVAQKAIDNE